MIKAILKHFGYVRKSETVSIDDYMRLRASSEELLRAYQEFVLTVRNNANDAQNFHLPSNPDIVVLAEWKKKHVHI